MSLHIHAPQPSIIKDLSSDAGWIDAFGRRVAQCDDCKKNRKIENLEAHYVEWYGWYIYCKKGKGCKKKGYKRRTRAW